MSRCVICGVDDDGTHAFPAMLRYLGHSAEIEALVAHPRCLARAQKEKIERDRSARKEKRA